MGPISLGVGLPKLIVEDLGLCVGDGGVVETGSDGTLLIDIGRRFQRRRSSLAKCACGGWGGEYAVAGQPT